MVEAHNVPDANPVEIMTDSKYSHEYLRPSTGRPRSIKSWFIGSSSESEPKTGTEIHWVAEHAGIPNEQAVVRPIKPSRAPDMSLLWVWLLKLQSPCPRSRPGRCPMNPSASIGSGSTLNAVVRTVHEPTGASRHEPQVIGALDGLFHGQVGMEHLCSTHPVDGLVDLW